MVLPYDIPTCQAIKIAAEDGLGALTAEQRKLVLKTGLGTFDGGRLNEMILEEDIKIMHQLGLLNLDYLMACQPDETSN